MTDQTAIVALAQAIVARLAHESPLVIDAGTCPELRYCPDLTVAALEARGVRVSRGLALDGTLVLTLYRGPTAPALEVQS